MRVRGRAADGRSARTLGARRVEEIDLKSADAARPQVAEEGTRGATSGASRRARGRRGRHQGVARAQARRQRRASRVLSRTSGAPGRPRSEASHSRARRRARGGGGGGRRASRRSPRVAPVAPGGESPAVVDGDSAGGAVERASGRPAPTWRGGDVCLKRVFSPPAAGKGGMARVYGERAARRAKARGNARRRAPSASVRGARASAIVSVGAEARAERPAPARAVETLDPRGAVQRSKGGGAAETPRCSTRQTPRKRLTRWRVDRGSPSASVRDTTGRRRRQRRVGASARAASKRPKPGRQSIATSRALWGGRAGLLERDALERAGPVSRHATDRPSPPGSATRTVSAPVVPVTAPSAARVRVIERARGPSARWATSFTPVTRAPPDSTEGSRRPTRTWKPAGVGVARRRRDEWCVPAAREREEDGGRLDPTASLVVVVPPRRPGLRHCPAASRRAARAFSSARASEWRGRHTARARRPSRASRPTPGACAQRR